jgi:hypothetical protein
MAQLVLAKQATFDKPAKNRHMRPLYLKGYVNGKPLTKMFVDGGAAVNVMPYTTFRKLGMGPGDFTPTSIILNDFAGNPSDTKGCVHVDLMIGSKTLCWGVTRKVRMTAQTQERVLSTCKFKAGAQRDCDSLCK